MRQGIFIVFAILFICGCNVKKKEIKEMDKNPKTKEIEMKFGFYDGPDIMKYVYKDKTGCIHSTRKCKLLDSVYQITRIDTMDLKKDSYEFVCANCINDLQDEHIQRTVIRNDSDKIAPYRKSHIMQLKQQRIINN